MSDEPKKDWSRVEAIIKEKDSSKSSPAIEGTLVPLPTEPAAVATSVSVPSPQDVESQGFLTKYKAGQLQRKAVLSALEQHYNSQLDVMKHSILESAKVRKVQISNAAEQSLKVLDEKHLEVLAQLGIRNADARWKHVTDLTDRAVARIAEVQAKNWPESLINETIGDIMTTRQRVASEIMRELGAEYSNE